MFYTKRLFHHPHARLACVPQLSNELHSIDFWRSLHYKNTTCLYGDTILIDSGDAIASS